jgi:transcription elongation factor GreA
MESQEVFLTNDGLQKAVALLESLKTEGRAKVARYLHEAQESGDVIDNAAYEDAKNDQARLEGRILQLEHLIAKAKLINPTPTDEVSIGSVVHLREAEGREYEYTIVGAFEAAPKLKLISNESPVGRALLGHKSGDQVMVSTPGGVKVYTILSIK